MFYSAKRQHQEGSGCIVYKDSYTGTALLVQAQPKARPTLKFEVDIATGEMQLDQWKNVCCRLLHTTGLCRAVPLESLWQTCGFSFPSPSLRV